MLPGLMGTRICISRFVMRPTLDLPSVPSTLNRIVFLKSLPIAGFGVDKPYSPPIIKRICIF